MGNFSYLKNFFIKNQNINKVNFNFKPILIILNKTLIKK